jgi:protein subunit release factor A
MSFTQKLDGIVSKFHELEAKLLDPSSLGQNFARISKEHSDMIPIVALIEDHKKTVKSFNDKEKS